MPSIEVDDETYKFLLECQILLKTQDNRSTRDVIFFNEYPERYYADYGDGYYTDNHEWIFTDCYAPVSDEDLFECMMQNYEDEMKELEKLYEKDVENCDKKKLFSVWFNENLEDDYNDNLFDTINEIAYELKEDSMSYTEHKKYMEIFSALSDVRKISYREEMKICDFGLFSFFEADIKKHKELDGHNYKHGQHSYGGSIQRSPLMLQLRDWLLNQDFNVKGK